MSSHNHRSLNAPLQPAHNIEELTRQNIQTIAAMEAAAETARGVGERIADGFTAIVGSWTFLIIQSTLLCLWVVLNIVAWVKHWDPYPFILLNLALSFQAAYATPIIMISNNRQGRLAARRNQLDLQINLLAEQENTEMLRLLRSICEKLEIPMADGGAVRAMEQETKPDRLVKEMERIERDGCESSDKAKSPGAKN